VRASVGGCITHPVLGAAQYHAGNGKADLGAYCYTTLSPWHLCRAPGFVKGYALIEYAQKREAEAAISKMDGQQLLGQDVHVSWAFVKDAGAGADPSAAASGSGAVRASRRR
jgi:hypothetical protein